MNLPIFCCHHVYRSLMFLSINGFFCSLVQIYIFILVLGSFSLLKILMAITLLANSPLLYVSGWIISWSNRISFTAEHFSYSVIILIRLDAKILTEPESLPHRRRQRCCASHRKISRPPARIFLRANRCRCFAPATSCIRKFFPFRGDSQPQARIPAAKLSRSAAFEGACFWERKVWLSIVSSPRRPRWSAGDFSFCAQLFSFREGLLSGLREKGRTVHFPLLPYVLSALKITDNSIYLLIRDCCEKPNNYATSWLIKQ